jgi:hypothetical protein
MRARHDLLIAALLVLVPAAAAAQTSDPVAARGYLQQGFALKEQGRCNEAIPYFLESIRLDRQPKAFLDLADCEEKIGKLGVASTHFTEARDLSRWQGLEPERAIAEQHLQAIDKRLPRLIVRFAPDAPPSTIVARDGIDLGPIAFNSPLPTDVGKHLIVARGGGFQRSYEISIAEGETREVVVTPVGGEPLALTAPNPPGQRTPPPPYSDGTASVGLNTASPPGDSSPGTGQRIAGFGLMGAGAAGLVIGTIFGLKVGANNRDIDSICPTGEPCPPQSVAAYHGAVAEAKINRAAALVGFGVGAVFVGTGVVLVLTAPRRHASGTSVWVRPGLGSFGSGATIGGSW